jgi:hypothetical protein
MGTEHPFWRLDIRLLVVMSVVLPPMWDSSSRSSPRVFRFAYKASRGTWTAVQIDAGGIEIGGTHPEQRHIRQRTSRFMFGCP